MSDETSSADSSRSGRPDPEPAWPRLIKAIKRRFEERHAKKRDENAQDRAARRTASATVAIAFFTIVAVIVGGLQFWAIKGQLDEMRDEQRPWLSITAVRHGGINWYDAAVAIDVVFQIKNVGKSPAKSIFFGAKIVSKSKSDPIPLNRTMIDYSKTITGDITSVGNSGILLFPDQSTDQMVHLVFDFGRGLANKNKIKSLVVVPEIVACASYEFVSGEAKISCTVSDISDAYNVFGEANGGIIISKGDLPSESVNVGIPLNNYAN